MPKETTAIAKLKKEGKMFELLVHPENAYAYKQGKNISLNDVLISEEIFTDAKKGTRASEHEMVRLFGTDDGTAIAMIILKEGVVPQTEAMLKQGADQKRKQLIEMIHRNAVDPKTGKPHPITRIENALHEAKVRIDDNKSAESQVQTILKQLQPILPIKYETRQLIISVPVSYASNAVAILRQHGKILGEKWNADGSVTATLEIPAGLQEALETAVNALTHGNATLKLAGK